MTKLRGNRVFLNIPKKEESKLIVDENTKEALNKEMLKKMSRLMVYDVGDLVSDLNSGDLVLVDPQALQKAPIISISDTKDVLLVSPYDIIMVW
jgi:hypothetical protein